MKSLIKYILLNYKPSGSVFIEKTTAWYKHTERFEVKYSVSVVLGANNVIRIEANTFFNACKLIIATLDAKGFCTKGARSND